MNNKIEPGYSTESLDRGIKACKNNIKTFEQAIENEYATIKQFREMKEVISRKEAEAEMKKDLQEKIVIRRVPADDNKN